MKCLAYAGIVAAWAMAGQANEDECSLEQRCKADGKLRAIAENRERKRDLVIRHLPFGVHRNRHVAEGAPSKEKLLVQGGYVLLHDGDLRTALWPSNELTGGDAKAGDEGKRIDCFRRDERLDHSAGATRAVNREPIFDRGLEWASGVGQVRRGNMVTTPSTVLPQSVERMAMLPEVA